MTDGPTGELSNPESGVLRAYRAEAARAERTRLLDMLRLASGRGSYRTAVKLIEAQSGTTFDADSGPGTLWSSVSGECDSVEMYEFNEAEADGTPDPMPVRLVVVDGATDVVASAFLSLDEAERAFTDGLQLVRKIRKQRTAGQTGVTE